MASSTSELSRVGRLDVAVLMLVKGQLVDVESETYPELEAVPLGGRGLGGYPVPVG